jgi:predicted transcriptional regulator
LTFFPRALISTGMTRHDLTLRLQALGITAKQLAQRLGVTWRAVAKASANSSRNLTALIDALEIMTPEQRAAWLGDPPPDGDV